MYESYATLRSLPAAEARDTLVNLVLDLRRLLAQSGLRPDQKLLAIFDLLDKQIAPPPGPDSLDH
jgi:hypothetical protein